MFQKLMTNQIEIGGEEVKLKKKFKETKSSLFANAPFCIPVFKAWHYRVVDMADDKIVYGSLF